MRNFLKTAEREALKRRHQTERDRRIADRIKAVLLTDDGWSAAQIAQALLLDEGTVRRQVQEYLGEEKLAPENGGSTWKLSPSQTEELITHLTSTTYVRVRDICVHVKLVYGICYAVSGMYNWLKAQGFSYKKPQAVPARFDPNQQAFFIRFYQDLMNKTPEEEPILFGDGVHPTMATKVSYGWIRRGLRKPIAVQGSRTRLNLFGSIDLKRMSVRVSSYDRLDGDSIKDYLSFLRSCYVLAPGIHLIVDRGAYNMRKDVQKRAEDLGICLHYLPPYSPNLNPIERLWKVMNEHVRNNRFFETPRQFKDAILSFFENTWPCIAVNMVDRMNDNFQILKPAS